MRLRKQKKVGKYKENPGIEIQEQGFRVNEHRFEGREKEAFVQDFECSKEKTPSTHSASQLLSLSLFPFHNFSKPNTMRRCQVTSHLARHCVPHPTTTRTLFFFFFLILGKKLN
jgi:hypothetical protein